MIRKHLKTEDDIISYIGGNYALCLYLFLDLMQYGSDSNTVTVFIQEKKGVTTSILLEYYSCLHVYSSNNDFDAEELGLFIATRNLSMIYCTQKTAERIYNSLPESVLQYSRLSQGWVATIDKIDKKPMGLAERAKKEDFPQIVKMIYDDDDIGRSYDLDILTKQIEERNNEGYARNLVIKDGDVVIAHACTNAEFDNIAVVAELIVKKEYRNHGYGSEIWRDICSKLLTEGKEVFSFYYSTESRNLHLRIGFHEVCEWGKIVITHN